MRDALRFHQHPPPGRRLPPRSGRGAGPPAAEGSVGGWGRSFLHI